jgi:NADPH:quinone reductase-like Zn-dependent oxidoreductase
MQTLAEMIADGRLRACVDRAFPMAKVREALRALREESTRGRIVLRVGGREDSHAE